MQAVHDHHLGAYAGHKYIPFAMISPLEIKKSLGMHQGKSDFIDAKRIANYAWLHRDEIKPSILPAKCILKLQTLTLRDRLVRDRGGFEATLKNSVCY